MPVTLNGTSGLTFPDGSAQNTAATGFGFKNRIINGDMRISQRGTSFTSPASGAYTLDRWFVVWGGTAPATVAQVSGPTGFRNALQITGSASNTSLNIQQRIESLNCSDLSGATVTIQANLAASSSQTVVWQLLYPTAQDNYSSSTLIGSGTWAVTTTASTFTATVSNLPSGATNGLVLILFANNGGAFTSGTLTITGVQLEKGSTATAFDFRDYGRELAMCQRYYELFWADTNGQGIFSAPYSTQFRACWQFKTEKRAAATFGLQSAGVWSGTTPTAYPGRSTVGFYTASAVFYLTTSGPADVPMAYASAEL